MLYKPLAGVDQTEDVWVKLYAAGQTRDVIAEVDYFQKLRSVYNLRNPHAMVGEEADEEELDFEERVPEEDPQR